MEALPCTEFHHFATDRYRNLKLFNCLAACIVYMHLSLIDVRPVHGTLLRAVIAGSKNCNRCLVTTS